MNRQQHSDPELDRLTRQLLAGTVEKPGEPLCARVMSRIEQEKKQESAKPEESESDDDIGPMPVPKTSQNGQQSNETSEKKDGDEEEKRDDVPGVKVSVDITPMLLPVFKVTKC